MAIKKGKKRYTISLTESKMEKLKEAAAKSGGFTTYSAIFEVALDDLIKKQEAVK